MDDWSVSDTARAAANGEASNPTKPVTLTQTRFFMDDGTWPLHSRPRNRKYSFHLASLPTMTADADTVRRRDRGPFNPLTKSY
jgi:hypothetical protein